MTEVGSLASRPGPCRGRWPWGFVGLVGLVLLVEIGLARVGGDFLSYNGADWRRMGEVARSRDAARSEVLCFGDSLVKTGVAPAVLEARLERPAFNLAVMAGTTPASYFLFRRALDAGARPRAVVYDANEAQIWSYRCRDMVASWAMLIGPGEALEMARVEDDLGFFGRYLVHRLLPSVRFRHELRKATLDRLAHRPPETEIPWQPVVDRQHAVNRGALFYTPSHPKEGPDPREGGVLTGVEWRMWYTRRWRAWPPHLVYLDKFMALAASRDIPVFLLVPPIHPGVQAERDRSGLDAPYLALMRKVHDRYPNVVVADGRHIGFEHGLFTDSCHLNLEGAMALSRSLADVVGRRLDGLEPGRWAAMAPVREPRARLAVEDVGASIANVAARR